MALKLYALCNAEQYASMCGSKRAGDWRNPALLETLRLQLDRTCAKPVTSNSCRLNSASSTFLCAKVQLIVSPIVVDAFCEPEAPVIVSVYCPAVTEFPAVKVSVLLVVAGFCENDAVTPLGRPDTLSCTLPVKPYSSVM